MAAEKDLQAKELVDLRVAAQAVVDTVDPVEEGTDPRPLLERLWDVPQRIAGYLSETSKQYMEHVLVLVKSYWPGANLSPLGDGLSAECSDEKFAEYVEEVKPIAEKIIDSLEQPSDGEA